MSESSSTPAQRFDIAQKFIRVFTGSPDTVIRVRFVHDSDRNANLTAEREGNLTQLWPDILEHQKRGYGVFYFLNEITPGPGSGYGGAAKDDDVVLIRALATDYDTGLPDTWHMQPPIVVRTSQVEVKGKIIQKGQALWPVFDLPKAEFKAAQLRLAAHYRSDTSISNPSRVLRLPGTLHVKKPANPQLVTFEDYTDGRDLWEYRLTADDILDGLPVAQEVRSHDEPSLATGTPVPAEHLRMLLGFIDADTPYPQWRDIVAAVGATTIVADEDGSVRRQIAHEFSEGKLDRHGRYKDAPPSRYTGADAVNQLLDTMPPKAGGVGYGTVFHAAKCVGYNGPPALPSIAETFARFSDNQADGGSQRGATGGASLLPFLMSESDIFALPDPEELIAGFLMKGENVCFYGPPKVGKTFMALDIALSLAANLPVFGHVATKTTGPVVYLSGEGHSGMKRRIKAWREARGIAPDRRLPFYYKTAVPMTKTGMIEAQRYIDGIKNYLGETPVLVVIDTMARSMAGLDENSSGDAGQYLELTEALRSALTCTLLTLAHSGKKLDHGLRGSTAFAAGFDAVWVAEMNVANRTVKLDAEYLKDAEDLGPFCFRLKHIQVEGMELGKGAVLEYVPLSEFNKTVAEDEAHEARKRICDALQDYGAIGVERGLTTRHFAEIRVGKPPSESDRKACREWDTAVAKEEEHLDNCSRVRHGGRRPPYEGYYERVALEGGKRLVKLWFLPAHGATEAPLAAE